jgi:hypothetical protein
MTSEQLKALATLMGENKTAPAASNSPWALNTPYFIQTVTWAYTGRLIKASDLELVLEDAALIADTGRFADAMKSGDYSEVEPYPSGKTVIIGRYSIVSAVQVDSLPREQK